MQATPFSVRIRGSTLSLGQPTIAHLFEAALERSYTPTRWARSSLPYSSSSCIVRFGKGGGCALAFDRFTVPRVPRSAWADRNFLVCFRYDPPLETRFGGWLQHRLSQQVPRAGTHRLTRINRKVSSRRDPSTVLFDVDDTLADSNFHHVVAWHRHAFLDVGQEVPCWRTLGCIGRVWRRIAQRSARLTSWPTSTARMSRSCT